MAKCMNLKFRVTSSISIDLLLIWQLFNNLCAAANDYKMYTILMGNRYSSSSSVAVLNLVATKHSLHKLSHNFYIMFCNHRDYCDWFSIQMLHEYIWLFINYCFQILHVCMCIHSLRCRVDVTLTYFTPPLHWKTTFPIIDQCSFPPVSSFHQLFCTWLILWNTDIVNIMSSTDIPYPWRIYRRVKGQDLSPPGAKTPI